MNRCERLPGAQHAIAGFAYLWVLLLVALMGLGLTVGVEMHTTSIQRDKEKELLAIGHQFRTAIASYVQTRASGPATDKRVYPASLNDLLQDNRSPGVRRHLRRVFVDPMTGKSEWGLVLMGGKIIGVHSLSERTPIKQDRFEADDMSFQFKQKYSDWVFTYPSDMLLRPASPSDVADKTPPSLDGHGASRSGLPQSDSREQRSKP